MERVIAANTTSGGAVAAGHQLTAAAAAQVLRDGGNAFDAAIAGFFVACVAEPVLASLGGGGFLLAHTERQTSLFDFFVHTPMHKNNNPTDIDFHPIHADFGEVRQEFHIGLGAAATPGTVRGMFAVHRKLARMPMRELMQPAIDLAANGVRINAFQSYLFGVVAPIYQTESARELFISERAPHQLPQTGDCFVNRALADTLDALAEQGEELFYQGELGARMIAQCKSRGHLTRDDLRRYRVIERAPLAIRYRDARLLTNPPPSAGGLLIGFALEMLKAIDLRDCKFGQAAHLHALRRAMLVTASARAAHFADGATAKLLHPKLLAQYRNQVRTRAHASRGTTHLSIIDSARNIASLTVSNGEGCGALVPDAGFMLNNMLGEEDLTPGAIGDWRVNQRMASMMAPSVLLTKDAACALGSGGSNRIRSAILQVVCNLTDFAMNAHDAVQSPRMHIEGDALRLESGFDPTARAELESHFADVHAFAEANMFFGGVHLAQCNPHGNFVAVGDLRRDGVGVTVTV